MDDEGQEEEVVDDATFWLRELDWGRSMRGRQA